MFYLQLNVELCQILNPKFLKHHLGILLLPSYLKLEMSQLGQAFLTDVINILIVILFLPDNKFLHFWLNSNPYSYPFTIIHCIPSGIIFPIVLDTPCD